MAPAPLQGALSVDNLTFQVESRPGQVTRRSVEVTNTGEETVTVVTSVGNWIQRPDGSERYLQDSTGPRSAESWLNVYPRRFELSPGGKREVVVRVNPPSGSNSSPGEYRAMVFVRTSRLHRTTRGNGSARRMRIRVIERLGIKFHIRMPGPIQRRADITSMSLQTIQGSPAVRITVHNRGNVHLDGKGVIRVRSMEGRQLSSRGIPSFSILPGDTRVLTVPFDVGPGGSEPLSLLAVLDYGVPELIAGELTVRPAQWKDTSRRE